MNPRLQAAWDRLRGSFWFVPALLGLLGTGLAGLSVWVDVQVGPHYVEGLWWLYSGGPEGARSVLSTVATSMIAVAGTTFSITIAVLTLASQQFGPRLLRTFMRDRGNQVVLGTFIGTFIYCLLVLRTVRGSGAEADELVPLISVTLGAGLGVVSLGALVYFIHHVATSIQVSHVIEEVGQVLDATIDRLYPQPIGEGGPPPAQEEPLEREAGCRVHAGRDGYLLSADSDALLRLASREDLLVRVEVRPGEYVVQGDHVATVWPNDAGGDIAGRVLDALDFSAQRNELQDVEFAVEQLVEVCLRALSPSINDPFTAINAIDRLAASLARLAAHDIPSRYRYSQEGKLRVMAHRASLEGIVTLAFDQPRRHARGHLPVLLRLLDAAATIARHTRHRTVLATLREQAQQLAEGNAAQATAGDRQRLSARLETALAVIGAAEQRLA
ncbi:MAG TPA: DUF2254 domain-containing protein [Deinococcales bacterium]|nr:DUF2254 domain-containing protein [Deinococcales bacterium]